ncbi:hypothetical protein MSG37_09390 [Shewanella sp. 1CM18E]|uniref:GapS1 family protein n=1 Tax=Shewanella sp. 1CM18E TaxID=2929169 RepID=UPI0020BED868|nr:hypothetical protein [Shewanella sp. 1CM18E]MCK8045099.1 hypothetical protein [Shewanella sp. 1CM18E]
MKFSRQVKKVKSLIRGYDAVDLLDALYRYMNAEVSNDLERLNRHPWIIMLIAKWNLLENRVNPDYAKVLRNNEFNNILSMTYDLGNLVKMPGEGSHYRNFMRNMAYQQFMYQKTLSTTILGSNQLLFSSLPENNRLKTRFREITDLDIKTFSQCVLVISTAFETSKSITVDTFEPIFDAVDRNNLEKTLNLLSVELHKVKGILQSVDCSNGTYSEWYEQTPFLKFPIVRQDGRYTCMNKFILIRCIEGYIYDLLKSDNSQWFMDNFGKIFESYLKNGLDYSKSVYVEETAIKIGLPRNTNVVDFVIKEDGCNVFIDAKGVELPYLGKVSDDAKVILGKVKSSALKAIKQANVLNDHIRSNGSDSVEYQNTNYLLVVTYRELYLGNGIEFYESIAKKNIDDIFNGIDERSKIPLENTYFLNIEEFDLMCSVVQSTELTFAQIIEHAKKDDRMAETRKFDFLQHLNSLDVNLLRPDYLHAPIQELTDYLR